MTRVGCLVFSLSGICFDNGRNFGFVQISQDFIRIFKYT